MHFFCALSKLQVIARNSDWFTVFSTPVVIGLRITSFFDRLLKCMTSKKKILRPTLSHCDVDRSMRTSGSHLLVFGEFKRSLFEGETGAANEDVYPFKRLLGGRGNLLVALANPSIGPKNQQITHLFYDHTNNRFPELNSGIQLTLSHP